VQGQELTPIFFQTIQKDLIVFRHKTDRLSIIITLDYVMRIGRQAVGVKGTNPLIVLMVECPAATEPYRTMIRGDGLDALVILDISAIKLYSNTYNSRRPPWMR